METITSEQPSNRTDFRCTRKTNDLRGWMEMCLSTLVTVPYVDLRRGTILKFGLGLFRVESVEHEVDHGQFDESLRRSDTFLPVLGQPSALAQPRKGPLHHPADR